MQELKNALKPREAFIIISPGNRMYLTGFDSTDGYLIITDKKIIFLTDSRYIEAAKAGAKNCDEILLLKKASDQLPDIIKSFGIGTVYTEADAISVSELKQLRRILGCSVLSSKTDKLLTDLRRQKSTVEKSLIVRSQKIAEAAFDHILGFIKPGVTEKEIRLELEYYMLCNGADALSFETIAISGENTSKPHGVPTDKKVKSGEFITMDYGASVSGYRSDMTRTIALGTVSSKQEEIYSTVLKAQLAALDSIKAGVKCKTADAAARNIINDAGYGEYFGHGTGHGVGIDIHEAPSLSPRSRETLRYGDIVTAEPGIYIPEKFGVRIEDMVFVTENGCENLTECKKELIVIPC